MDEARTRLAEEGMAAGMAAGMTAGRMAAGPQDGMAEGQSGVTELDLAAGEASDEGLGADDAEIVESLAILDSPDVPDSLEGLEGHEGYDARLNEAYGAADAATQEAAPRKKAVRGRRPCTGRRRGRPRKSEQKQQVPEAGSSPEVAGAGVPGPDMPAQCVPEAVVAGSAGTGTDAPAPDAEQGAAQAVQGEARDGAGEAPAKGGRCYRVANFSNPLTLEDWRKERGGETTPYDEMLKRNTPPYLRYLKPGTDTRRISIADAQKMMRDRLGLVDNGVCYSRHAPMTFFCSDDGVPCYREPEIQQDDMPGQQAHAYPEAQPYQNGQPYPEGQDEAGPETAAAVAGHRNAGPEWRGAQGRDRRGSGFPDAAEGKRGGDQKQYWNTQEEHAVQNAVQDSDRRPGPECLEHTDRQEHPDRQDHPDRPGKAPEPHSGAGSSPRQKRGRKLSFAGWLCVLIILAALAALVVWFSWTGAYGDGGEGRPGSFAGEAEQAGRAGLNRPQALEQEKMQDKRRTEEQGKYGVFNADAVQGVQGAQGDLPDAVSDDLSDNGPDASPDGSSKGALEGALGRASAKDFLPDAAAPDDLMAQEGRLSEEGLSEDDVLSFLAGKEAARESSREAARETSREKSRETSREMSRETSGEAPKATGKAEQKGPAAAREGSASSPAAQDGAKTARETASNSSRDTGRKTGKKSGMTNPASQAEVPQASAPASRDGTGLEARLSAFEESLQKTEAGLLLLQQLLRDSLKDKAAGESAVPAKAKTQDRNKDGRNKDGIKEDKKDSKKNAQKDSSAKAGSANDRSAKDSPGKAGQKKEASVSSSENPALKGWRIQGLSESRAILQDARGRIWNMGAGEQTATFMVHRVDAAKGLVYTSRGILSLKAGK